jgi:hypothetical protein
MTGSDGELDGLFAIRQRAPVYLHAAALGSVLVWPGAHAVHWRSEVELGGADT